MELVSLIIMVLGVVALIGIYVISRISRRNLPQKGDETVPTLRDTDGDEISSVLDDVPARDGKRPAPNAKEMSDVMMTGIAGRSRTAKPEQESIALPPQLVFFIAADIEAGFSGEAVLKALNNAGLQFGEMDIFHRVILTENGESNLFGIANGIRPWTLTPDDLVHQSTPGLSMILNLPSPIEDSEAIQDFIRTAEQLAAELNGVLKDQNQKPITPEIRAGLLKLAA